MEEKYKKRIESYPLHNSMRGHFGFELYKQMAENEKIVILTGDLGYKLFDPIKEDFPERFINCGASEQAMIGIAVGLALKGKIPFVYSITPFLVVRALEWIRNYLNHEGINVKLVGSGRDKDYEHDGISHFADDIKPILDVYPNIVQYWPEDKESIESVVKDMLSTDKPGFLSLRR